MAGLGRKTFIATEVLTAANVNGYLMDQSVMKYANTTAASSAIGTAISEGMQFYLSDTDEQVFYNGSSFAKQNGTTNAIINGAFDIFQRGTSVALTGNGYTADRWSVNTGQSTTTTQQLTSDTTNLPNIRYAGRFQRNSGNTSTINIAVSQSLETANSREFAGKNVTLSFYARKGANFSSTLFNAFIFSGTGTDQGIFSYTGQATVATQAITLTTGWVKYTLTGAVASTANELAVYFDWSPTGTAGAADYVEITGVQLEAGSVATPFKRNAPSIGLEETNAYRYTQTKSSPTGSKVIAYGSAYSSTKAYIMIPHSPNMRTGATSVDFSNVYLSDGVSDFGNASSVTLVLPSPTQTLLDVTVAGGLTQFRPVFLQTRDGSSILRLNNEL